MQIILNTAYSFKQLGNRTNQEDARFPDSDVADGLFFVVCDGVGGNEAGEVASSVVCRSLGQSLGYEVGRRPFSGRVLTRVLAKAHEDLCAAGNGTSRNMATTLTLVVFHEKGVTMSHIGDSRIYQFRKGKGIHYRSEDHSLVQELVSAGQITEEQARVHPLNNIITRSLSARTAESSPATTCVTTDVEEGDIFLLCTDGVLSEITDAELTGLMSSEASDEEKLVRLSEICRNSSDNNTAILVSVAEVNRGETLFYGEGRTFPGIFPAEDIKRLLKKLINICHKRHLFLFLCAE